MDLPTDSLFYELAIIMILAGAAGGLALLLRQPLILAFIVVGIAAGPAGFGLVAVDEQFHLLATLGISLLLFVVGLKLDVHVIRTMGLVALITAVAQVVVTFAAGFGLSLALGIAPTPALFVAIGLTFSSTVIIVKLLSDKREIDALHGKLAVGILIVQDMVVVVVLIGLSGFVDPQAASSLAEAGSAILAGATGLAVLALLTKYALPAATRLLARSPELLVLFAFAWALSLATLSDQLGFGTEIGAFLAGVSLASTPYREAIGSRLVTVRDFLLLFFFVTLGASLDLSAVGTIIGPALILSLFVLVGKPLILMVLLGLAGFRKRTGFVTGITMAQISEFSLILAAVALRLGYVDGAAVAMITLVGLISIGLSAYMIQYSHAIYDRIGGRLGIFERDNPHREEAEDDPKETDRVDVILFGLGRYGGNMAGGLRERNIEVLGVDFDPQVVRRWHDERLPVRYGDAEDPEFPSALPLDQAGWVVSTMPQLDINLTLFRSLRHHDFAGRIALTAHNDRDASRLKEVGADLVLRPFEDAAKEAVDVIGGQD